MPSLLAHVHLVCSDLFIHFYAFGITLNALNAVYMGALGGLIDRQLPNYILLLKCLTTIFSCI